MKKMSIRAISLLLCVAMLVGYIVLPDMPAAQAESEIITTTVPELIENGTFGERKLITAYPQRTMPPEWSVGGNFVEDVVYQQVTNEDAYDGEYSMKFVDASTEKATSYYQAITSITPDDAGKTFTASIYIKGSGKVQLTMECFSSDTSFVTSGASKTLIQSSAKTLTATDAWALYTNTNTIPEGTEAIRYKVTTNAAFMCDLFCDKMGFVVGDSKENLLANGSVETLPSKKPTTQMAGEDASGWGNLDGMWSLVPEEGNESNVVAKIEDTDSAAEQFIYYGVDVEPGDKYTFKVDYKGSYTSGSPAVFLRQDSYDNQTNLYEHSTSLGDTWNTYETTVEIPDGVTKLFVVLSSAADAQGTAYFDNVSLKPVVTSNDDDKVVGGEVVAPDEQVKIHELNLMTNPYFEMTLHNYVTRLNASKAPNGWTLETVGTNVKLYKSNKTARDGEWSIQAVDDSATGYFKLSYKVENIVAGQEYQYMYTRTGTGNPGMYVRYYDAEGTMLQEFFNAQGGYDDWRQSRKYALAPEGTSYAIVSLESTPAQKCDIYLDNVFFYSSADVDTNLLPNHSFEEYPEDFEDVLVSITNEPTFKDWTLTTNASYISLVKTETELDKDAVGNYMVKFDDQLPNGTLKMHYEMDVEAGTTYFFGANIRGEYTSSAPHLRLTFYADEACTQVVRIVKKDKEYQAAYARSLSPDSWNYASASALAPEGAIKARISVVSAGGALGYAYFGDMFVSESAPIKFANLDFEDLNADGTMRSWESHEGGKLSVYTKDPIAGKMSLAVKDNSEAVQQGAISMMTNLSGYQYSANSSAELRYTLGARIKAAKNVKAQLTFVYYDYGFNEVGRDSVTVTGTGKWKLALLESMMPAKGVYAKILVTVGDKAAAKGTVYVDDITIVSEYLDRMPEPNDWQIKEKEGTRLYFTDEELEVIREFGKDDTINAFGASGANAYRAIIKSADRAITETSYIAKFDGGNATDRIPYYTVYLDHIQDISADPLLQDVPGGRNWPYLEGISNGIYGRMLDVSMAYALTGDTKYSEKAIGWAMDLCEWEYWCETKYCWPSYNGTLDNPRLMRAVAVVYDMCYDQMTQEQRDLCVENLILKGMKPLCHDLDNPAMTFHNKYMMRCVGILIAGAAIINEENKDVVGPLLDKAYAFCEDFIEARYTTDDNEGYSYNRVNTDYMIEAMECLQRVTGRAGLIEHPYFTEVLVDWVIDFMAPTTNEWPVYSDSYESGFYVPTMLILNKYLGVGKAGYFLQQVGMGVDEFTTLIYGAYDPVITPPDENDYVAYAKRVGYGGLRTGWEDGELMFYIIGNNSNTGHNHYDQLSFQITSEGLWPAYDPGYSNLKDGFMEQQGHNIILVDGQWQTVKGQGTLTPVVDGQLYGQFEGSAPGAYMAADEEGNLTVPLLTQWDRNAIMINHGDRPYYIVIDEMASDTERTFDFNLNTGGWFEVTVDGKAMADGINKGNKVAVYGEEGYLFVEYVSKKKMNIEAVTYDDGGPVLQADSGSAKSKQYMTILTKQYGIEVDESYSFLPLLNTPEVVSYKTSSNDSTIIKSVGGAGVPLFFFRGHKNGDWIELPFSVNEGGEFELILKTAKSYNYGIYKISIDGKEVATYDGYDLKVFALNISLGKHELAAGDHILRLELIGKNSKSLDSLISVGSITFATEREMPAHPIYTQEVYDTDKVLGAKIYHTENNYDIVLHNRTSGKVTAGGVTTTGEQAVIIGQMADGYMEGFTVVAGTSLVFDGKTLMKSSSKATVSADFRGKAKYFVETDKAQSISLYVPYEVVGATVDGKSVKYSVSGNVAKVSVPAGTHTVALLVKEAVEYLRGDEIGYGEARYDENGEIIYKYWNGEDGTEYLFEDGQVKINAYYHERNKVLIREEMLENGDWQTTTYDLIGNISTIKIEHVNGNVTTIKYLDDGSISTTVTDKRGNNLEMIMEYKDGSKTVAEYLDDKAVTTKYDANGKVYAVTTMYNDGRRVDETYDENGKLLSVITRYKGGNRDEVVYNADGSVVTSVYTAGKLTSIKTVNADGTSVLEEYLEDGSIRVTKYDKDGNVTEVTIDGKLVEDDNNNLWLIIVIVAVAVVGVAALVIVLLKIKKKNSNEAVSEE